MLSGLELFLSDWYKTIVLDLISKDGDPVLWLYIPILQAVILTESQLLSTSKL